MINLFKTKTIWLVVFLVIFIIIAGFYIFQWWQVKGELTEKIGENESLMKQADELQKEIKELKAAEEKVTNETAEWKTYKDEKWGFEIDYPIGGFNKWTFNRIERKYPDRDIIFSIDNKRGFSLSGTIEFFDPDCYPLDLDWENIYPCSLLGEIAVISGKEIKSDFGMIGYKIEKGTAHSVYMGGVIFPFKLIKIKSDFPPMIIHGNDVTYPVLVMDYYLEVEEYPSPSLSEMKIFDKIFSSLRYIGD